MAIGRIPEPLAGIQEAILDAKGDLISATAADTPARLAVGSNNQILMADSAQSTGLKWAASATSTLTAKGDLLTATAANTIARLGVGADGTTLVADSTQSTGLKWATPSGGKILQVVSATYNTEVSSSSTTLVDTGLTASITPSSTSSKILIFVSHNGARATNHALKSTLNRGATELCVIDLYLGYTAGNIVGVSNSINWLDSPNTTSATTYKTRFCSQDGSASVSLQKDGAYSTITLMEVSA